MSLVEVRRRIRPLLPEPGKMVFPQDDSEVDGGPVDNKPTTHLAAPVEPLSLPRRSGWPPIQGRCRGPCQRVRRRSAPLAPVPGPLPFTRQPVARPVRRGRSRLVAGGADAGRRRAVRGRGRWRIRRRRGCCPAGRSLPPPVAPTTSAPAGSAGDEFVPVTAQAPVLNSTQAGGFSVVGAAGWTKFVEQRTRRRRRIVAAGQHGGALGEAGRHGGSERRTVPRRGLVATADSRTSTRSERHRQRGPAVPRRCPALLTLFRDRRRHRCAACYFTFTDAVRRHGPVGGVGDGADRPGTHRRVRPVRQDQPEFPRDRLTRRWCGWPGFRRLPSVTSTNVDLARAAAEAIAERTGVTSTTWPSFSVPAGGPPPT